ncbi:glycosyltransferase [Arthrobacter sp. BHU FT2]|nr:glycosyltransferase [Arthrobacter sp. BHU FT2]
MPSVSVVIRAFNEGQHLGRLLAGLKQQTIRPDEIIVVDSGSTDNTVQIATDLGCRVVTIAKEDFSFGRSLNLGCESAESDILLIVSAHVYPIHDSYVEHMLRPFTDPKTSIAYGRQVGDHRTKFSESRIMLKWFPEESIWDQGHPFSNNANAAVRKVTWEKFKYNEDLTGLEDLDFANRVISQGARVAYVAEAPVVHVHEETWDIIQNRYRREAIAYKRIMDNEKMSAFKALRLAGVNIVSDYWHAAKDRCLIQNLTSIPRFRAAQFYGAWEGFRNSGQVTEELLRRFYYPADAIKASEQESLGSVIDYDALDATAVRK